VGTSDGKNRRSKIGRYCPLKKLLSNCHQGGLHVQYLYVFKKDTDISRLSEVRRQNLVFLKTFLSNSARR
jgi:hypothetical protein